jgi:hypothetical protein
MLWPHRDLGNNPISGRKFEGFRFTGTEVANRNASQFACSIVTAIILRQDRFHPVDVDKLVPWLAEHGDSR